MTAASVKARVRLERAARLLGWVSLGIGLAEVLMPRRVGRAGRLEHRPALLRACGAREIAIGLALLNARDPAPWLWGRVAGDAFDLAVLGQAARAGRPPATALAVVAGVTLFDLSCAATGQRVGRQALEGATAAVDYSRRSGFPRAASAMRGAALADFDMPEDMRIPVLLRPYGSGSPPEATAPRDALSDMPA